MTMWLNASGTKHKNPFEEKAKLAKENIDYINPSPEFENGTLNSIQSGRKLAPPPIPSRLVPMQMLSSHTPTRIGSGYKSAFIGGTLNSLLGKALTPVAEKIADRKVDLSTLPQPTTFGEKALSFGSGMVADLPLWLAGDALLAKPLSALAKTKPITRATGLLPKAITPALGTGIRAGTTYGLPINALETALDGDGVEGFTDRLKQAPLMGLGGAALHGAGQLVGKGVKTGVDYAKFNKLTKLPEMQVNPLDDLQNAYRNPITKRDAKTNSEPLTQKQPRPLVNYKIKETITPQQRFNEVMQSESSTGKPIKTYRKNTDVDEITTRMNKQVDDIEVMVKQADEQTLIGSIRKTIKDMGGIRQADDGIFEERKVIPNWIRNDRTGRPLDEVADTLGMTSDELLAAISDSAYKPKNYRAEAEALALKDPDYIALDNTLQTLRAELSGKVKLLRKDKITTPEDFPFPVKDMPIVRYQKETGPATYSDLRGGTWHNRVNDIHGENTGYNAEGKTVGGMNKLRENYTPQKPLLVNDTTSPGAGQAAIRSIKGEEYLDDVYVAYADGPDATKAILKEVGLSEQQATELLSHPDQPQILFDRIGTELAKKAGYDSIVHTTPNGTYAEVVKLDSSPMRVKAINGPIKLKAREDTLPVNTSPKIRPKVQLKPRELKAPQPVGPRPTERVLPEKPDRLTWTNRDVISSNGGPAPITREGLKRLPENNAKTPIKRHSSISRGLIKENTDFDSTIDLEIPVVNGRVDVANAVEKIRPARSVAANIERPRRETLTLDRTQPIVENRANELAQGTKIVGAEPDIPVGMKERGAAENIRTDANRPDELRDSFSADPLVYKQLGNKETLAKAQTIFDKGIEPAITELDVLIKDLKPEAAPLVKMIADKLTLDGNIARARELMSTAANRATESGQFGQAFRILRDADPETFLMTFDKMLKKLNKEGLDQYGKKWKDFDLKPNELDMIGKIERGNQTAYDDVLEKIQARMANEMPSSAFEKINAWRHISMLFNPKTHIRNVVGNGIMMAMRKSAQRVSGAIQKVLPEAKRTQSVFVKKEYKDLASEYFEANGKELLSGANKFQEGISPTMRDKRVFRKSRIGEKLGKDIDILEKTRKFNYELLQMGDTPFFRNAYIDRLASYAQAKGEKDFSKLSQEAFDIARLEAEQATYKDASVIADFINKVKHPSKDASFGRKAGAVLTEAALPFTKTPINIIKRGMQYSPIGVANGLAGINSSKGAAMAIDELAKGLSGTGVLGLGYILASKGVLTGKSEKDVDLREYNKNTGQYPFSVFGKYSFDWAQPLSVPLSVGVEIYNAVKDNPEDVAKMDKVIASNDTEKLTKMASSISSAIVDGLNASGDTVFNMSVMRGVKLLLGGQQGVMEGLAQLPQNYATQFIPTLSNQISGTVDPLVRQTYVKGDMTKSFKNSIQSRIPLASKSLQPKQTPFGEDMKKIENPIGRAFGQFLSPGIITKNQNIPPKIDSELRRLNEFGLTKQFPTIVPNYIEKTQAHPRISLSPTETTAYQKRVGELTLDSFGKIIDRGSYSNARPIKSKNKTADEVRADLLADAISDAKAQAKKEILKGKGYR